HRRLRATHDAAIDDADRLVTKTHAQQRRRRPEAANYVDRDACVLGSAGAWRDDDLIRRHRADLVEPDLVVAAHAYGGPELAEVLHEVVGERVVVIDDQNHF